MERDFAPQWVLDLWSGVLGVLQSGAQQAITDPLFWIVIAACIAIIRLRAAGWRI